MKNTWALFLMLYNVLFRQKTSINLVDKQQKRLRDRRRQYSVLECRKVTDRDEVSKGDKWNMQHSDITLHWGVIGSETKGWALAA